jgi:hypothetical protein
VNHLAVVRTGPHARARLTFDDDDAVSALGEGAGRGEPYDAASDDCGIDP